MTQVNTVNKAGNDSPADVLEHFLAGRIVERLTTENKEEYYP